MTSSVTPTADSTHHLQLTLHKIAKLQAAACNTAAQMGAQIERGEVCPCRLDEMISPLGHGQFRSDLANSGGYKNLIELRKVVTAVCDCNPRPIFYSGPSDPWDGSHLPKRLAGVYALFNVDGDIIYVGRSLVCVKQRLTEHRHWRRGKPGNFRWAAYCPLYEFTTDDISDLEAVLIAHFKPDLNLVQPRTTTQKAEDAW